MTATAAIILGLVVLGIVAELYAFHRLLWRNRTITCVCCGQERPGVHDLNVCGPCYQRYG